jgi:protein-tyrosine phosphatase
MTESVPGGIVRERLVVLDGACNVRDVGGYATADGRRRVRWGLVFRADSLDGCSAADHTVLAARGIRTVCDLRRPGEGVETPPPFLGDGRYLRFAMDGAASEGHTMADRVIAGEIGGLDVEWMVGVYAGLAQGYAARFGEILRLVATGEVPLLFHCAAGKDRTGLTAALLLHALGVSDDDVFDDYALTDTYRAGIREKLRARLAANGVDYDDVAAFFGAPRVVIERTFAGLRERYGSVEGYLDTEAGVGPTEIAGLREVLLEPART